MNYYLIGITAYFIISLLIFDLSKIKTTKQAICLLIFSLLSWFSVLTTCVLFIYSKFENNK